MNSFLLYEQTDKLMDPQYFDAKSIIQDLNLRSMFLAAAKEVIYDEDQEHVKKIGKEDPYIQDCMRKVMMIPLREEDQILYRQEILRDFLKNEDLIKAFYEISSRVLAEWNKLGRSVMEKMSNANPMMKLITDVRVITLMTENLSEIRGRLKECSLHSRGLRGFAERLDAEFSEEREAYVKKILEDVSFYVDGGETEDADNKVIRPKIVVECGLEDGLKFSSLKLQEVSSYRQKFYKPGSTMSKIQDFKHSRIPDSFSATKETAVKDQAAMLELQVVSYVVGSMASILSDFGTFFDSLHLQSAFYLGAVNLRHQMGRFQLDYCFPTVCEKDKLSFKELKEFVMCLEQRVSAVGNTCKMEHKMLLIVTGANQGGKSTFLRSIGIAQVMMQAGLMVAAQKYESAIFPDLFTHFTRREDSEMNSGRLDEELNRMDQIIKNLGERPLLLLNESFATTTEKEGSVIAYDIIKALGEAGVKILTVTHLLSFAQRAYQERSASENSCIEFLSAERKPGGIRTFKMIQHAPELTSFGLDLYEEIVERKGEA